MNKATQSEKIKDSVNSNRRAFNNEGNNTHQTGELRSQNDQNNSLVNNRDIEKASENSSAKQKREGKLSKFYDQFKRNWDLSKNDSNGKKFSIR